MIKKLLVGACLLLSFISFAQEGSYSPYSFYGIGDARFKGTIENRSMGGVSVFPDSIHLNIQNPASYSALRLTTFAIGGTSSWVNLKTESQEEKAKRFTLDYLAMAFPIKKGAVALGLMPYSSVGYKIRYKETLSEGEETAKNYTGTGGVNRVFVAAGYELSRNFRIGADVNFNFGEIETNTLQTTEGIQFGTREINRSGLSGFGLNLGAMYERKLNNMLHGFAGATFSPATTLRSKNYRNIATVQLLQVGGLLVVDQDTIFYDRKDKLKIPMKFSVGAGIGEPRKWQAATEVTFTGAKDGKNRFSDIGSSEFENAIKYSIGGYYIPNYNSYSSYAARVVYRAGARYENTGLVLNSKSIYDAAGTLGFGLPIRGSISNINIGLEYGKRGTKAYGLVEEKYFNMSIGLSFNDRWFVKRKYD